MNSNRIGIFGGTFNPVHCGHLIIAQEIALEKKLDQIRFVPNARPPHKANSGLIDASHRFEMLKCAIRDNTLFAVDDYEMQHDGYAYTIDTMSHFKKIFENPELYFIIGADSLLELHQWKDAGQLVEQFSFIIAQRHGAKLNSSVFDKLPFDKPLRDKLQNSVVETPVIEIASSGIRTRISQGIPIRYLVPEPVREYIEQNNLYSEYTKED